MDTGAISQLPMWLTKVCRAFLITDEQQIKFIQYSVGNMVYLFPNTEGFDEELSRAIEAQPGPLEQISEGGNRATATKVI